MRTLIEGGRIIDPASGLDTTGDVAIAGSRIVALGRAPEDFVAQRHIDATGCIVLPGLVDLAARLSEPGQQHASVLESEMAAAVSGGVTSLVCPPDANPVLDEPGLVEMLALRSAQLHQARLFALGALTRHLQGEALTDMLALTAAGCVGFGQADTPIRNTQVLLRALQYAHTFGYTVWLRPQDPWLSGGVAASGALSMRMGLSSVPVQAETIALLSLFELVKHSGARVHICRLSSAQGAALVRQAKAQGLPISCDVSIHSLHLTDTDMGYFDARARLNPPLRQSADRAALRAALADGTIDALVSDHTPVGADAKTLPFAQAQAGASAVEMLLPMALQWAQADGLPLSTAIAAVTHRPAQVLGAALGTLSASVGRLSPGGAADLCIWDPAIVWQPNAQSLRSRSAHTPFAQQKLQGRVRTTLVDGQVV